MMTCSIPAATASSTAYWMIGLSTSGSISLGCALVAGRKRVPQPAAGKTALRTRIEPRVGGLWTKYTAGFCGPLCGRPLSGRQRPGEFGHRRSEQVGAIELGEVGRPRDHSPSAVLR